MHKPSVEMSQNMVFKIINFFKEHLDRINFKLKKATKSKNLK